MPNGHPQFGGTGGAPLLDIGQDGGSRQGAGSARLSGYIMRGADLVTTVRHHFPQQNLNIEDNLGFTGARHTLVGVIRASTRSLFNTILCELDQRKSGHLRDSAGALGAFDPQYIKPTKLTDFDGSVIAADATLTNWRMTGRGIRTNTSWTFAPIVIEFGVLA